MPTEIWERFIEYAKARARETSTWQALILIATAFGVKFSEDEKAAVLAIGLGVAGLLSAIFPDRVGNPQSRSTDQGDKQ